MDDLGIGYDVLKTVNPRLIYATGSGFGITGPDRDNLAMDFTIQAQSGIMSVTGFPDGPPVKAGPTLVDFMGGIHLYAAVVTALFQRERTGAGQLVEVAMQETVYSSLASSMEYHVRTGEIPPAPATANPPSPAHRTMRSPRRTAGSPSMSSPKATGRTC
jgi:CoA:oxalate CoA-transferase